MKDLRGGKEDLWNVGVAGFVVGTGISLFTSTKHYIDINLWIEKTNVLRNVILIGSTFSMISMLIEGAVKDRTFTVKVKQTEK